MTAKLLYNKRTRMSDKPKGKVPTRLTPYQFSKNHPELGLRSQAIYQHCLKQAAPHVRERNGRILIDDAEFMSWLSNRHTERQLKAARKTKSK